MRALSRLPGQYDALRIKMCLHLNVRVLPWRDGDWSVAERARRRDAVVLVRVELIALVRLGEEVVVAECVAAVLALDREEVDEHARLRGALLADGKEPGVSFWGR